MIVTERRTPSPSGSTNAAAGLLAAMIATPLAAALVPTDYEPAGALFFPALVLTIGFLAVPIACTIRSPISLFRVEHLIMIGLIYWLLLDLLQGAYTLSNVSRDGVVGGISAVGLFAIGVWMACLLPAWSLPRVVDRAARADLGPQSLFGAVIVCAGLSLFRYALPCGFDPILMITSLAGARWSTPWGRGSLGGWDAFIDHLSYFGYLLPTLTVLLAHRLRGWLNPQVICSVFLAILVTLFLAQSGSRRVIGVTMGSATICWVLLRGSKLRLSSLLVPSASGAILLLIMQTMLLYRGIGYGEMLNDQEVESSYKHLHVDDNILRLSQIIDIVPDSHPFTYEKQFVWAIIRPVPRVLWPGKPLTPGFDLPEILGSTGVSLSSSVVGEFYLSWGFPTVFLGGLLYGRLAGTCNRLLGAGTNPVRLLMYSVGAMAIFAGLRSIVDLVLMGYITLAWLGVNAIFATRGSPDAKPVPAR